MSKAEYSAQAGKSWKSEITKVYDTDGRLVVYDTVGPKTCPVCGQVIRYDTHGWACCDCQIYNDRDNTVDRTKQKRARSARKDGIEKFANVCRQAL
jgi:hypothetical protein